MNVLVTSGIVTILVFLAGVLGLHLQRFLPAAHLSKETHEVIKLGTGMLSVLASLVLGLMIASVKSSFDNTSTAVRTYAADLIVLDDTLRDFGDAALPVRRQLRDYTVHVLNDVWRTRDAHPFFEENRQAGEMIARVWNSVRALPVDGHDQQLLASQALDVATSLLRQRWLLIERAGPSVQPLVIVILVAWIAAIFVSFGINGPRHATMYAVFLILSLSVGSAILLVLEMDRAFEGELRISEKPIETALTHMLPEGQ
jgi:hypothetical protein